MQTKGKFADSTDSVRHYLSELGRVPLLTLEQEIQYARQVRRLIELERQKDALTDELGYEPDMLEWADAMGLKANELERLKHQGQRAKQKMLEANLRLVVSIAKKYQHRGLELLDLIQEGSLGLSRAVEKFDPEKGYKFSTYATWWIRQGITRAIADKSSVVRLPVHLREKMSRIKKAGSMLSQQLGRIPSVEELSTEVCMVPSNVRQLFQHFYRPVSLDQPVGQDRNSCLGDLLQSDADPFDYVQLEWYSAIAQNLLDNLNEQQRYIISQRYGLVDGIEKTFRHLGQELGLSHERVRQIEQKGLRLLKETIKNEEFGDEQ